jgi:hypothetical protein
LGCFQAAERYFKQHYPEVNLGLDKQAKAVSQLCFYLHDPAASCREDSHILLPNATDNSVPKQQAMHAKQGMATQKPNKMGTDGKSEPREQSGKDKEFAFDKYPPRKQWETIKSATDALMEHLDEVPSGHGERNGFWTRLGYAYRDWFKKLESGSVNLDAINGSGQSMPDKGDNHPRSDKPEKVDTQKLIEDARTYLLELAAQYYSGGTQPVQNALESSGGTCGLGTLFKYAKDYAHWEPPWNHADVENSPDVYLTCLYPELVNAYGDPLNFSWEEESKDGPLIWKCKGLNERFFAALLMREGNDRDPAVYDQNENSWFRYDSRGFYGPVKAEALYEPLDKLLLQTARECAGPCIDTK